MKLDVSSMSISPAHRKNWIVMILYFSLSLPSFAQDILIPRAHDSWQTIQTQHFTVHFPSDLEDWSVHIAERMESIHTRVTDYIGFYEIDRPVNVIVMDPLGIPNGMAVPFLGSPRIVLWPTAPVNPLMLGGLEAWSELVMIHEYAHAVHLTRKPRNRQSKWFSHFVPLGPVSLKLPLWAVEGYAVLIESELTGYGRVNSSLRSMIFSQLAIEGKLPEYALLNGGDQWMSGRYPYLIGSAFLEWLLEKSDNPDALLHLWKRMTARKNRSFDDAFSGVFQNTPQNLYARFRAELTAEGLKLENHLKDSGDIIEGDVWQYIGGMTGEPSVSPDGTMLATVVRERNKPSRLVVWSTEYEDDSADDPAVNDPDDVPGLPVHPPKRRELYSFVSRNGVIPSGLRFVPDGKSILFHAYRRRSDGDYRSDIFQWFYKTDTLVRHTKGASLSWPDPSGDASFAVALRQKHGHSEVVRLDLKTGVVTSITEPSIDTVWQNPRICSRNSVIAAVRRLKNRSELVIMCIDSGTITVMPSGEREVVLYPAWIPDSDQIIFCSDRSGIINLEILDVNTMIRKQVTQSISGVLAPEPARNTPDGYYFLKPHADGMNIHYAELHSSVPVFEPVSDTRWTLPPASVAVPSPLERFEINSPQPYRAVHNLEYGTASGYTWLPYSSFLQWGLRSGDILGRFHGMAIGSVAFDGGIQGGMIAAAYRGWPFHAVVKGFYETQKHENQRLIDGVDIVLPDIQTQGIEITVSRRFYGEIWQSDLSAGAVWSQFSTNNSITGDRMLAGIEHSFDMFGNRGHLRYGASLVTGIRAGKTSNRNWSQADVLSSLYCGWNHTGIRLTYSEGTTYRNAHWSDMYRAGGATGTVQSEWLYSNQLQLPWLPAGTHMAHRYTKMDAQILVGHDMPLTVYATSIHLWNTDSRFEERVAGVQWELSLPYIPLFRLSSVKMTTGVAYGLEGSIKNKWRGYLVTGIFI